MSYYQPNLGEVIYTARISLAMTQSELARRVKVSRQTVNYWENGKAEPELKHATQLMEILDLTSDEVFATKHPALKGRKK